MLLPPLAWETWETSVAFASRVSLEDLFCSWLQPWRLDLLLALLVVWKTCELAVCSAV